MITANLTGNLGNHMWQYAVCRTIAEKLGYEWGINSSPTHDYHNGMNQMYFMDVDFGKPVVGQFVDFHEKWTNYNYNGQIINVTKLDHRIYDIDDNTRLIGDNGAFGGIYQSEKYFEDNKQDVKNWFKIKPEFVEEYNKILSSNGIILDDNLCVINFRGGEYRNIPHVLCRREYWRDSINHIKSINQDIKFIVITDDPHYAKMYMPFDIPCYHFDIGCDFYTINQSKWVILSNSTFGWWAAWLNTKANKILAPKYWASHNFSDGFWSVGESYTTNFHYVDRNGEVLNYNTCVYEAENYYKTKNI